MKGGKEKINKRVDLNKPLKKIVTTIMSDESNLYSVEFFFVDGSYEKMSAEDPELAGGRAQTIEFAQGEMLLGAVLHHSDWSTWGVEWITGRSNVI